MVATGLAEKITEDAKQLMSIARSRKRSLTYREMLKLTFGEYPLQELDIRTHDSILDASISLYKSVKDKALTQAAW